MRLELSSTYSCGAMVKLDLPDGRDVKAMFVNILCSSEETILHKRATGSASALKIIQEPLPSFQ